MIPTWTMTDMPHFMREAFELEDMELAARRLNFTIDRGVAYEFARWRDYRLQAGEHFILLHSENDTTMHPGTLGQARESEPDWVQVQWMDHLHYEYRIGPDDLVRRVRIEWVDTRLMGIGKTLDRLDKTILLADEVATGVMRVVRRNVD